MRLITIWVITACLVVAGAACGGRGNTARQAGTTPTSLAAAEGNAAIVTAESVPAGTEEQAPTAANVPTSAPTSVPMPNPTATDTPEPTSTPSPAVATSAPESTKEASPEGSPRPIAYSEPMRLQYKYAKGDELRYDYKLRATVTPPRGAGRPVEVNLDALLLATVEKVKAGNGMVRVDYEKLSGESAGRPLFPGGQQPPKQLLDQLTMTVEVDELGNQQSRRYKSSALQGVANYPSQNAASFLGPVFPRKALAPGDKWTSRQKTNEQDPNSPTTTIRYTLKDWVEIDGVRLARIEAVSTIPKTSMGQGVSAQGRSTFTFLFDPQGSKTVQMDGSAKLLISLPTQSGGKAQSADAVYDFDVSLVR